ncbi:hypothetical protein CPB86DRAFT_759193 [Serendipita vermifera]|nr:hypothetical protein CPB86DRAFT_759193 [Serendipita vermifera]
MANLHQRFGILCLSPQKFDGKRPLAGRLQDGTSLNPPMSSTPRLVGTLIVVVLKARNLPNKRHIGKQDPYCTLKLHNDTKRTKAVKRGGQHPEWDEELRFEIFEDMEDELARTAHGGANSPPAPPPKDQQKEKKIKGGKKMRLLCYADDPREPELIGETIVDLSESLTKGETDEWYTLMNKDKYSGEVYLEMTFWSNVSPSITRNSIVIKFLTGPSKSGTQDKPPEKKPAARPSNLHPQYGGPGSFTPSSSDSLGRQGRDSSGGSPAGSNRASYHEKQSSTPGDGRQQPLSSTSSLANLNLYIPPYERDARHPKKYDPSMEFGDPARRRDSYPPHNMTQSSFGFQNHTYGQPANPNPYDTVSQPPQPDPYASSPSAYYQSSQSAQFTNSLYQPHAPSGFVPQPSITPSPSGFQPLYTGFGAPRPAATPIPSFIPPSSSMGFHNYQTNTPTGFAGQPIQPAPTPVNPQPPIFQHHPNSFPSTLHTNGQGSNLQFTPPIQSATAPPMQPYGTATQQVPGIYSQQQQSIQSQQQSPNQLNAQGRPLPDQPQQTTISFPTPAPYNQTNVGTNPTIPVQTSNAKPGFVPPPPPPSLTNQAHRTNSLPTSTPGAASASTLNASLPVPPQQQHSQQTTGGNVSTNSTGSNGGRGGLPLPPLPNPPGGVQSAFHTGPPVTTGTGGGLPGPPPALPQVQYGQPQQGHQQQPSNQYAAQPAYNPQQPQQQPPQQMYPNQPIQGNPWQQQQQPQQGFVSSGFAPVQQHQQQYSQFQPAATPAPQVGGYYPQTQVQTQWH